MEPFVIAVPDSQGIQNETALLVRQANELVIQDADSHAVGQLILSRLTEKSRAIQELFAPMKQAAHEAHKIVCAREKEALLGTTHGRSVISDKLGIYEREQERLAKLEQARLEAEARKAAEEQALREAALLEAAGAPADTTEAVLAAAIEGPVAVPKVQTQTVKVNGVTAREYWAAQVTDMVMLVKFVANNPQFINLIQANTAALNAMARANKDSLKIPGVRAVATKGYAVS